MTDNLILLLQKKLGIWPSMAESAALIIGATVVLLCSLLLYHLFRSHLLKLIHHVIRKTSNQWDDVLLDAGIFERLPYLALTIALYIGFDKLFAGQGMLEFTSRIAFAGVILIAAQTISCFLMAAEKLYLRVGKGGVIVRNYVQSVKIILYIFAGIFIIAEILDRSPWGLFGLLGGLTAVLLLIFKDTILGFVASIQLSAHDMVRIGDWVSMPKYNADGDVIDVTVNTVKVRNWDKTITTIPTYALISDSFQNWRGMFESGGRRIKRVLHIDMRGIKFCTPEILERFGKVDILQDYITSKEGDIQLFNRERGVDLSLEINGRRQTNIGVFRAYVEAYLRDHPAINNEMTFLVRHLQPTSKGLPLEIYVFCKDQRWAHYEAIQADIFDHLLAALPIFELRVFQEPSGGDLAELCKEFSTMKCNDNSL